MKSPSACSVRPFITCILLFIAVFKVKTADQSGYWESRLWRTFADQRVSSGLAFDASGRLVMLAYAPGVCSAIDASDLARWDGVRWEMIPAASIGTKGLSLAILGNDIWVGGTFAYAGRGATGPGSLARWTNGGWEGLGFKGSDTVAALAVNGHQLVACGTFTNIGNVTATNVALWDGAAWQALGEGVPASRLANVAIAGNDIFLLREQLASPAKDIWHWDGSHWNQLPATVPPSLPETAGFAPDSRIQRDSIARHDLAGKTGATMVWWRNSLVVAGYPTFSGLCRFQGGVWQSMSSDRAQILPIGMALQNDDLIVHGVIQLIAGDQTNTCSIARFDGEDWTPLLGPEAHPVRSLQVRGQELFAVGTHTNRDLYQSNTQLIWQFDGRRWSILNGGLNGVGTASSSIATVPEGFAATVTTERGRKSIGIWDGGRWQVPETDSGDTNEVLSPGQFIANDGRQTWATARLQPPFSPLGGGTNVLIRLQDGVWRPASTPHPINVTRLAADGGGVLLAGSDTSEVSKPTAIWRWRASGWTTLDHPLPDGTRIGSAKVTALAAFAGDAVIGVSTQPDATTVNHFCARFIGDAWVSLGLFDKPVSVLHATGDRLLAGGTFTTANGESCPRIAQWDGTRWNPIGGGLPSGSVSAVAQSQDGRIAVGGTFRFNSATNLVIWRDGQWHSDAGTLWDGSVQTLAWSGNDLGVGGPFYNVGIESLGFAVWHDSGIKLTSTGDESDSIATRISGAVPARFELQSSIDLASWATFTTNTIGNPTPTFSGPSAPANQRFFRIAPQP